MSPVVALVIYYENESVLQRAFSNRGEGRTKIQNGNSSVETRLDSSPETREYGEGFFADISVWGERNWKFGKISYRRTAL